MFQPCPPRSFPLGLRSTTGAPSPRPVDGSELQPYAGVEDTAFQWRPHIGRPAPVDRLCRQEKRVVMRLTHVGEVFCVEEYVHLSDARLAEDSQLHVRRADGSIGVVLKALAPRVR